MTIKINAYAAQRLFSSTSAQISAGLFSELRLYSGTEPTAVNDAITGTLLAIPGLGESLALAAGAVTHWRLVTSADDDGAASAMWPRLQGAIGDLTISKTILTTSDLVRIKTFSLSVADPCSALTAVSGSAVLNGSPLNEFILGG